MPLIRKKFALFARMRNLYGASFMCPIHVVRMTM